MTELTLDVMTISMHLVEAVSRTKRIFTKVQDMHFNNTRDDRAIKSQQN